MSKMKWKKAKKDNIVAFACAGEFSDNDRYKVIRYGEFWYAYFKPKGWKSFGNSCEKTAREGSRPYLTKEDAKKACEAHLKKLELNANQNNFL